MHLTPTERDRLLLFSAAELARKRRARGQLLNVPESIAIVADTVAEAARDGLRLTEAIDRGRRALRPDEVLPGVADVVRQVEVEAVFDDGTRLAVVPAPLGPPGARAGNTGAGVDQLAAAPGAILPAVPPASERDRDDLVQLTVVNDSPVPISVTSHFHFFEVNPRLRFDRAAAWGTRLDVPVGSVQRFEPGAPTPVTVRPIGGGRVVVGFAGLVDGPLDAPGARDAALARARACGYLDSPAGESELTAESEPAGGQGDEGQQA